MIHEYSPLQLSTLATPLELTEFSFGQGMTSALFQAFGMFPLFREMLKVLIITRASTSVYVFQNQYGMSSGPDVVRFSFCRTLYTMYNENEGILVSLEINCKWREQHIRGQYLYFEVSVNYSWVYYGTNW